MQLEQEDEDSTAIVNMGLWDELKNGLSDLKKIAKPELRYMEKHAEKMVEKTLPVIEKMSESVGKKLGAEAPILAKIADALGLGKYIRAFAQEAEGDEKMLEQFLQGAEAYVKNAEENTMLNL